MHCPTVLHSGVSTYHFFFFKQKTAYEIAVFSPEHDPAAAWRRRAAAIRQTHMRSESDGHCLPTTFPGLAVREARRRRSLVPLLASVCDLYHPTVGEFLAHVEELRHRSRWDERI